MTHHTDAKNQTWMLYKVSKYLTTVPLLQSMSVVLCPCICRQLFACPCVSEDQSLILRLQMILNFSEASKAALSLVLSPALLRDIYLLLATLTILTYACPGSYITFSSALTCTLPYQNIFASSVIYSLIQSLSSL